jgi:ABC-type nitrate/sulfonate/bicarbonate transport system substrate-binding protein
VAAVTPEVTSVTIGFPGTDLAGQAPFLLADARGYFTDTGFESVELMPIEEPLPGVLNGELDFGVVEKLDAADAFTSELPLRAVAGYHNQVSADVTEPGPSPLATGSPAEPPVASPLAVASPSAGAVAYGGDLIAANTDFIAQNPPTVQALLIGYIRALRDLQDPANDEDLFAAAEAAGIEVSDETRAAWADMVVEFTPFDGGFGSVEQDGGLGELQEYLVTNLGAAPDFNAFIDIPTLNAAQAALGLPLNPDLGLAGAGQPELTSIAVGVRSADLEAQAPLLWARQRGYFTEAGFDDVAIQEATDPAAALAAGEVLLAVFDTLEAANVVAGGEPLQAVAGHHNFAPDGATYGGDLLAGRSEVIAGNPNTVRAFTVAWIRALQDLRDPANGEELFAAAEAAGLTVSGETRSAWPTSLGQFAPFDGGFGAADLGGGLEELQTYLTENGAPIPDLATFIAWAALNGAQSDLGLPLNPDPAAAGVTVPSPAATVAPEESVVP